ncbi:uncharacterized protein LOC143290902 [Babylonia areolata]|uniref:uncharacterized protein LOC143290902 n=1 Tax=Babylonia areolata TaxID=304850 RepID=UPI003FD61039
MRQEDGSLFFKCVLLGPPGVGKTCLVNRLAKGTFLDSPLSTLSTASLLTPLTLPDGAVATMDLWDTGGQERYRSLTASYFRNAQAVLVVYDADRRAQVADWLREAQYHLAHNQALVFLVGAKLDLGSDVMLTEAEVQALRQVGEKGLGIEGHYALSAKTGQNVEQTFAQVAECVWKAGQENRVDLSRRQGTVRIGKGGTHNRKARTCCS